MANSIIGFHYSVGGTKDGVGSWIANANSKGIPVGLKGVDDAGLCFEGQQTGQAHGVSNWLVYRVSTAGQDNGIEYDVPDYTKDPTIAAAEHFNKTVAKWPPELDKNIVWSEPINEPRAKLNPGDIQWNNMHPVNWLGWFMSEYAMIANAQGFKVCGPSFNSGEPEVFSINDYEQTGMLAYLDYCAANPGKAALSTHDYVWRLEPPQYPALWGRWEAAIAAADNAGIPRTFPIFVTEFGFAPDYAPSYPAVIPDLDIYNLICARFPQVKFAAAWTLQSGYDPVDDRVITWVNYPIDSTFNAGPQPAETHSLFGGTLPGDIPPMPEDILINPDFEGGYAIVPGHDNIRYPARWDFWYAPESLPNPIAPNDPNAVLRQPEAHVLGRESIPDHEESDFIYDGDHTWKVFGKNRSIYFTLGQTLPPGTYDLSFHIFTDMYEWVGSKDFCNDPHCCVIWVETDQGETAEVRPLIGQANRLTFRINVGNNGRFDVHFLFTWAVDNNGAWIDGFSAERVEAPPPPPPTGTFEERLWKASILEQRTNGVVFNPALGLWKQILADGLHVVTHERPFEGVNYQVGEKPEKSERWVYTWTAAEGIKRFKWPEDVPPAPFEFAAYPVKGRPYTITSPFNAPRSYGRHEGIDLSAPMGNPILAVADGVVEYVRAEDTSGYGLYVRVKHSDRFKTWYAHLQAVSVTVGQVVTAGQELGLADSTGNSTGSHLHLTVQDLEQGLDGYVVAKVVNPKPFLDALVSTPAPGVFMPPYFLPAIGDYAAICILKNSWGQNDERQQLQRVGNLSYVTKNNQWERRSIRSDGIYLEMDTSPGGGEYYTIEGTPWLPLSWSVGSEWLRSETVKFFWKENCQPSRTPYTALSKIRFEALHNSWTSPTGVILSKVIELQWIVNGLVEESYWFAEGLGLVQWKNRAGKHSWITERIPAGQQGNNVREVGCFG